MSRQSSRVMVSFNILRLKPLAGQLTPLLKIKTYAESSSLLIRIDTL